MESSSQHLYFGPGHRSVLDPQVFLQRLASPSPLGEIKISESRRNQLVLHQNSPFYTNLYPQTDLKGRCLSSLGNKGNAAVPPKLANSHSVLITLSKICSLQGERTARNPRKRHRIPFFEPNKNSSAKAAWELEGFGKALCFVSIGPCWGLPNLCSHL